MNIEDRIERALADAVGRAGAGSCPPKLAEAIGYAVFPGGARMRPRLAVAVAEACGVRDRSAVDAAAAALELMHCASLVHDDLPCFDNADLRRGKPTIHHAFSEPIAVLVGDAMIVMAFETIARGAAASPQLMGSLVGILSRAVGAPHGIIAGQAWESEETVDLVAYQKAKTGALFTAAVELGALCAGTDPRSWTRVGEQLGEAYQVADDLHDAYSTCEDLGKPTGQDAFHGRPNAVCELGAEKSLARLKGLLDGAVEAIPVCPGQQELRLMVERETQRFIPRQLAKCAA